MSCVVIIWPRSLSKYFENTKRSGGGDVEKVKIKGEVTRIKIESAEGNYFSAFRTE